MQFEKAYSIFIEKLEKELSPSLTYHDAAHTKEVLQSVKYLAEAENISGTDLQLLLTAALFHDTGFFKGYKNHEELSCDIAKKFLPQFGYSKEQIETVCELIMSTKLPQSPSNKLGEILCDADLYYLGTDNFFATAEKLFLEFKTHGVVANLDEWNKLQIKFLEDHHYFTQTAINELRLKKEQNVLLLKAKLNSVKVQEKTNKKYTIFQDVLLISFGVFIAGFALEGILVPNHFFDGGVTGISLLILGFYHHFNLSYIILLANLPFIITSFFTVSRSFAFKTFACVLLLSLCLLFVPYPAYTTSDKFLVSIFGGFFLGVGLGLIMRAGSAADGIEILALYTGKRTSFSITEIVLAINAVIFAIAAFQFGIATAFYSMVTYFTASRSIDYVVEGIEAYTGVTIISGKSDIIKDRLVNELGRGITVYKGERGFLPGSFEVHNDVDIIFTVITRLELRRLKKLVHEVDPNAFVFASVIKEAIGGVMKRRRVNH